MSTTAPTSHSEPSPTGLVSVKTASQMLGLTPWDVVKFCESGSLPSAHIGERIVIPREAVNAFAMKAAS